MRDADLWSNLITGTFALGGAFLGFLGSWFAATRAAKTTREQIQASREQAQQDRIHERRDEAVTESYARILALDEEYSRILTERSFSDKKSKRKELDHLVVDMTLGWREYFRKNQPWIPELVAGKMVRIAHDYQGHAIDLRESLEKASEAQLPEVLAGGASSLEDMKEALDFEWLRFDVRAALGIEDSDIDTRDALRSRSRDPE